MKKKSPPRVFLDANVHIGMGRRTDAPLRIALRKLAAAGKLRLVVTDVTVNEIVKKRVQEDLAQIGDFARPHVQKRLGQTLGVVIPAHNKAAFQKKVWDLNEAETRATLASLPAEILPVDIVSPSTVLQAYSKGEGLFSGNAKKDQFPDAFILGALDAHGSSGGRIRIVTNDGDYKDTVQDAANLRGPYTMAELLKEVADNAEEIAIDAFLEGSNDDLVKHAQAEIDNMEFLLRDQWEGDVEDVTVTAVGIDDVSEFTIEKKNVTVLGTMRLTLEASYSHPNYDTAMYDSEDKIAYPWEQVQGDLTDLVDMSFTLNVKLDDQNFPAVITEFQFEDVGYVVLDPSDHDEY